jgi:hypothetical protein
MKTDLLSVLEAACVVGAIALVGCSSDSASSPAGQAGCPAEDAGCPGKDAGCPGAEAGCPAAAATPGDAQTPPTGEEAAITAWLAKGDYKTWNCEAAPHDGRAPSPHGKNRICSNTVLSAHGSGEFPVGAAGVKELYDAAGTNIVGYATYRKMTAGGGDAWYWFETMGGSVVVNGLGTSGTAKTVCVGCHAGAGSDATHSGHDQVYTQVK